MRCLCSRSACPCVLPRPLPREAAAALRLIFTPLCFVPKLHTGVPVLGALLSGMSWSVHKGTEGAQSDGPSPRTRPAASCPQWLLTSPSGGGSRCRSGQSWAILSPAAAHADSRFVWFAFLAGLEHSRAPAPQVLSCKSVCAALASPGDANLLSRGLRQWNAHRRSRDGCSPSET